MSGIQRAEEESVQQQQRGPCGLLYFPPQKALWIMYVY